MTVASERFEERLLGELRQVVAGRTAPEETRRHRAPRRRIVIGGVGIAAAAAVVGVVAIGSDVTPNAYAVQSHANGAVTVSISRLRDASGLQSSLRAVGVPAVVDYAPPGSPGCIVPVPEGAAHVIGTLGVSTAGAATTAANAGPGIASAVPAPVAVDGDGVVKITIDPSAIKPGQQVYITSRAGTVGSIATAVTAEPPSTDCVTAKAPSQG